MSHFTLGLVGERGAGKSTVARLIFEILNKHNRTVAALKSSDVLGETLDLWYLEKTTQNLQKLGRAMRDTYGLDAIPNVMRQRMTQATADLVMWDGIRWFGDEVLIRETKPSALLYVTTRAPLRYERLMERREKAEEKRDSPVSFEEFLEVEKQENEKDIPVIGSRADFLIVNNGDNLGNLKLKVLNVLRSCELVPLP